MKYANIIFDRNERLTIGDDIQLIAIEKIYNRMGINRDQIVRIPFHDLGDYDGEEVVLPIAFPFHGYYSGVKITQFSLKIIPIFLSISIMTDSFSKEEIEYLKKYEPIGCRDQHTAISLRKAGINAYVNMCMTATFEKRDIRIEKGIVYLVDVPQKIMEIIPANYRNQAKISSHSYYACELKNGPEQKARELLNEYKNNARIMITTRLHAALPCVAMGIPTILIKDNLSFRFLGLNKLIPIYTKKDYDKIDWNPSEIDYEDIKKCMIELAMKRIRLQHVEDHEIEIINRFWENDIVGDYYIEFFSNTVEFLEEKYDYMDSFEYILWGVTQTATMIYGYISKKYRNAKLISVIDKKKRVEFCDGIVSEPKEVLKKYPHALCLVCVGAAVKESYEYFAEIGHGNYYQCGEDGIRHRLEKIC